MKLIHPQSGTGMNIFSTRSNWSRKLALISMLAGLVTPLVAISSSHAEDTTTVVVHVSGIYRTLVAEHLLLDGVDQPMVATDDYGSFAMVKPPVDRKLRLAYMGKTFDPIDVSNLQEIWLPIQGTKVQPSRAFAQGYLAVYIPDSVTADLKVEGDASAAAVAGSELNGYRQVQIPVSELSKKISITLPGETTVHQVDVQKWGAVWLKPGKAIEFYSQSFADGYGLIHYRRADANYAGWAMHLWDGYSATAPAVTWAAGMKPSGIDVWGEYWKVPLAPDASKMSYIIHKGDTKDGSVDQVLDLTKTGGEVWFYSGNVNSDNVHVYTAPVVKTVDVDLKKQRAIWLTPTTIAWPYGKDSADQSFSLVYSKNAGITIDQKLLSGTSYPLTWKDGLDPSLKAQFPYLSSYNTLIIPDSLSSNSSDLKELLKGQLALVATQGAGAIVSHATGVQIGDVLDSVYNYSGPLGITFTKGVPTLRLWAPTAQSVELLRYSKSGSTAKTTLKLDSKSGVWSGIGKTNWIGSYFNYQVKVYAPTTAAIETNIVTDPYSVALSTNSHQSMIADLNDPSTMPAGFLKLTKPKLAAIADSSIYELHVRDFSAIDTSVPVAMRGKFLAFTVKNSNGMTHLAALAKAGLTHIHLLPVFDFATVNEDASAIIEPKLSELKALPAASDQQQKIVTAAANTDSYNWGYDPLNFNTPEGSYSSNPQGTTRVKEFRSTVAALNSIGLRVVMDVVYNHTNSAGQNANSTFDKIVPGYYYREGGDGSIFNSTCCANTATERKMMAKFVRDSILLWAIQYKVDGFRFDIMGHMPKALLVNIRMDLDKLTLVKNGVDGKKVILYGEGWNFGEVMNNARFPQATQAGLAGTNIGTFNDRLRDSVQGGGPFDDDPSAQGFGSGLFTNNNGDDKANGDPSKQQGILINLTDNVKMGLIGQLANYSLVNAFGKTVKGSDIVYTSQDSGYTAAPIETVNYVDGHDNLMLFDLLAYKLPLTTTAQDRARYQVFSLSTALLSQGIPFMAAGTDLMHSKSLDKDSYNSGDWFNAIDWTGADNGFGHGLPPAEKNASRYQWASAALNTASVKPTSEIALRTSSIVQDFFKIRYASPLFRLGTATNVMSRVQFLTAGPDQIPGVIVMRIVDNGATGYSKLADLDKKLKSEVVIFNGSNKEQIITLAELKGLQLSLNGAQNSGSDPVVKGASFTSSSGTLSIPAISTVVFDEK
jgi:pullulanase-type alpha-1,6-glucosidase